LPPFDDSLLFVAEEDSVENVVSQPINGSFSGGAVLRVGGVVLIREQMPRNIAFCW
jgi:hypothetical protein